MSTLKVNYANQGKKRKRKRRVEIVDHRDFEGPQTEAFDNANNRHSSILFEIFAKNVTFRNTLPRTEKTWVSAENGFSGASTLPRAAAPSSLTRFESIKVNS